MAVLEEKTHSTIMLCLADDIITEIVEEETAQGLWVKLEGLYMTKSLTNKLLLKQRLFSLRTQEAMPLRDHLDQLNTILLELRNIDVKVEDEDAALILLVSLPLSYENFVQSFIVGKDTVSLEEVRSFLHTRELRHKATGIGADNQAIGLVASGSYGHENSGKKKFKKPVSKGPKPNDVCNYCKEKGHWKSDFPKKKRQQDKPTGTVAVADTNSEEDIALVANEHFHHNDVKGVKRGTLYFLQGSTLSSFVAVASSEIDKDNMTKLWHMRLGHMSTRGMQILSKGDLLCGHKVKDLEFCEHWKKIKRLRTDNGLEFCWYEFDEFCKNEEIARHHIVRDTPQQNSLAERMNQTLLERARCILSNAGLTRMFWVEAVSTTCYLINRGPHTGIHLKTPFEVWSGKPVDYYSLRVFGCTVHYHVNEGKLEPRAKKGVFVGYGNGVKGYRIWSPSEKRVILSRNVVFDGNSMFNPIVKSIVVSENDDMLIAAENKSDVQKLKDLLNVEFEMKDLAKPIDTPSAANAHLSVAFAPKSAEEKEYMSRVPYASAVGSLMYAMCLVIGFSDSDYVGDVDSRRSMTGYAFTLGSSVVSWKATLQPTATLSTIEAEYMALTEAAKEGIWLRGLVSDLGLHHDQAIVYCDSLSAICLAKDQVHHERTKHIDVRYHFLRSEKRTKVSKVGTVDNPADMFTKSVPHSKFQHYLDLLNVRSC
ncbi:Retrovirus-related Pol polyprotein from transposon TNT 1-94 [Melia azedarach]|uniref:Retrovirus-related Pol polyprotein from transposon TNT 1-94 n=1 Tax=Melia azedarach TaxID=155640 RepID=A0ACC1YD84_MELAZ|nr:Retrovirus-related Pol polyprotein from transposon TNT 1-94 [Melia azedarach]